MKKRLLFFLILSLVINKAYSQSKEVKLFSNPLLFYNLDILSYQQTLHKYQRYEEMLPFFYGPLSLKKATLLNRISDEDFGYELKMVGSKKISDTEWSITYQKTITGTKRNFKVNCKQINDTCRIYLDESVYKSIFKD